MSLNAIFISAVTMTSSPTLTVALTNVSLITSCNTSTLVVSNSPTRGVRST